MDSKKILKLLNEIISLNEKSKTPPDDGGYYNLPGEKTYNSEKENNIDLNTYGDLKYILKWAKKNDKIDRVGGVIINTVIGSIPYLNAAKSLYDIVKAGFYREDKKESGTWLDKLDVDDDMSDIVDDQIENDFLEIISKMFESQPDDKVLPKDFNMNQEMIDYLKKEYNQRTIKGISENKKTMKLSELKSLIKEEYKIKEEETPSQEDVNSISKLGDKFIQTGRNAKQGKLKGIDKAEIEQLSILLDKILKNAQDSSATTVIKRLSNMIKDV